MTPHKIGKQVQIDPTIKSKKLAYGQVSFELYDAIGEIVNRHYSNRHKQETYEVEFHIEDEEPQRLWFLESELI